jgi:alkylation response protein AidB-like acyl-CoA dehydrogenase
MQFVIEELAPFHKVAKLPGCEEFSADLVQAVIEEAGKFAQGVLSPMNWPSDRQGARLLEGYRVQTSPGYSDAYLQFVEAGWHGLSGSTAHGGQGLPELLATAISEMWQSACMSFALCPMLTAGAIHAIESHGTDEQKHRYLEKMVSGQWSGTMNLTEPQAGSDLAAVTTKAVPVSGPEGGHYRISGTKIYITYGEHDLTENIIHLVLARLPDAPAGVKGISLFIVPKYLVLSDGSLGDRNDVRCISLEHKLGIHGSPTCVMSYGEKEGAVGYLVGEANRGLEYMFTMMNHARLQVGVQGISISDRAYQQAIWYAHDRVQGRVPGFGEETRPIADHPDVRRMLASMKGRIEAMRALAYEAAAYLDLAAGSEDPVQAKFAQARVDFLIPVVKAWCTEQSIEISSLGLQVHGGMGYVEETGAAQHFRDSRITTIYEGTTAIQANDFLGRKLVKDKGAELGRLVHEIEQTAQFLRSADHSGCKRLGDILARATKVWADAAQASLTGYSSSPAASFFGSVPLLMLSGYVLGGHMMGRAALIALPKQHQEPFYAQKLASACFYASHVLAPALGLAEAVHASATGLDEAQRFTQVS